MIYSYLCDVSKSENGESSSDERLSEVLERSCPSSVPQRHLSDVKRLFVGTDAVVVADAISL